MVAARRDGVETPLGIPLVGNATIVRYVRATERARTLEPASHRETRGTFDASIGVMHPELQELPLAEWTDTRETIHRWSQILGKIQLALTPQVNHWWNVALQISSHGIATTTIPYGERCFDMEMDFIDDVLRLRTSDGSQWVVPLGPRSVAEVYADVMASLEDARIEVHISPIPSEVAKGTPLYLDFDHASYDKEYVLRWHHAASWTSNMMARFRSDFIGKQSPVQLYWGHFDLSLTRFSGRRCITAPPADPIEREAYSHELFSVGWWAGDERFSKPAYYAYASPEPPGFPVARIESKHGYYYPPLRGYYMDYDDIRTADNPEDLVLEFFQTTYEAAANLGGWDRLALERGFAGGITDANVFAPTYAR